MAITLSQLIRNNMVGSEIFFRVIFKVNVRIILACQKKNILELQNTEL